MVFVLILVFGLSPFLIERLAPDAVEGPLGYLLGLFALAVILAGPYYTEHLNNQSLLCNALARALLRLARLAPTAALTRAAPHLTAISTDLIGQPPATRKEAERARATISNLIGTLPATTNDPIVNAEGLPRVATAAAGVTDTLPRTSDGNHARRFEETDSR